MASKEGGPTMGHGLNHDSTSSPIGPNPTRREKKRASDRLSQQATRARTKAYIAHLENTTEKLTEALAGNGAAVSTRMAEQYDKIEELKSVIARIAKIAYGVGGLGFTWTDVGTDIQQNPPSRDPSLSGEQENALTSPVASVPARDCGCFASETLQAPSPSPQESLQQVYPMLSLKCGNEARDYFGVLNQALLTIENNHARHLFSGPEVDDDTCIRTVLHSWTAARAKNPFDVGWQLLQVLDEGLFFRSGLVERMAILRTMRSMLMTKINPRLVLERRPPSFMNPTPLQAQVSHPRLIDYFVWPEIRDYLIISGISYAPESLAAQFAVDIGLKWPFTLRDTCTYQPSTGMYAFSKEFIEVCENLESWYFKSPVMSTHLPLSPDKFTTSMADDRPETLSRSWNMAPETSQESVSFDDPWEGVMLTENLESV